MTLDEARNGDGLAHWRNAEGEYLLDPAYGVVWWRPATAGRGDLLGKSWRIVSNGERLPRHGWKHKADCACRMCE